MDSEIIWLILLFIVLPLVEKVFRKRQQEAGERPDSESELDSRRTDAARETDRPAGQERRYKSDLERLIAEELGLEVPEPDEPTKAPPIGRPRARKPTGQVSSPYTPLPRSPSGSPQPRSKVVYPRSRVESRPPPPPEPKSLEVPPERSLDAQAINLDERAIEASEERARPKRKREAPAVARVGLRLGKPARAQTREARPGPRLPGSPEWSNVKKAIVWSEILGPPKALRED